MKRHLLGAMVTKAGPIGVQVLLLVYVAHDGSLADVGRFAVASATAYFCANFAEIGFASTLSVPKVYYGEDRPPLRATSAVRIGAALIGSLVYVVLWAVGLGHHHAVLLIAAPLPFAVALSAGLAGAMNASRRLDVEGRIALAESLATIVVAVVLGLLTSALAGALLGITIGRLSGMVARWVVVRGLPQSPARRVPQLFRTQLWFALGTAAVVIQGQADVLLIGFVGTLAFAGVYGPLIRVPYGLLLLAEALSWALYSADRPEAASRDRTLSERLRGPAALLPIGVGCAVVFACAIQPFLHVLLDRPVHISTWALLLFAVLIVVRFSSFALLVAIVRAGQQREGAAVTFAAGLVLVAGSLPAAAAGSFVGMAAARLASELVILVGYLVIRRLPRREAVPGLAVTPELGSP